MAKRSEASKGIETIWKQYDFSWVATKACFVPKTLTRRLVFETQEYEPHLNFFEICAYLMQLFNVVLELEL